VNEGPSEATRGEGREREFLPWRVAVGRKQGGGLQHQFVMEISARTPVYLQKVRQRRASMICVCG
jgi:hypothetical protein